MENAVAVKTRTSKRAELRPFQKKQKNLHLPLKSKHPYKTPTSINSITLFNYYFGPVR